MLKDSARFFLGANSRYGFISRFDSLCRGLDGWYIFILKGGPGTGKSSLMRRVGEAVAANGQEVICIQCGSDPKSLDGVVFPELKAAIVDGTAPHSLEAKYPGAAQEMINLGEFWDKRGIFAHRREIIALSEENSSLHADAARFISAAGLISANIRKLARPSVDRKKLGAFVTRLAAREFGRKPASGEGRAFAAFLSGITPDGVVACNDTMNRLCGRVIEIHDDFGAAGNLLLQALLSAALAAGHDVISCYCPMDPKEKLEHLIIPGLSLGFFTSNRWHKAGLPVEKRVSVTRFTDMPALRTHKNTVSFYHRAVREMLNEAVMLMDDARRCHDRLERIYMEHMNFDRVDQVADQLVERVLERQWQG